MTNTITILALIALAGISVPSAFACTEGQIQHWNGIEFFPLQTISGDNLPDLRPQSSYQIIVQVNPNDIIDALALVVEKLNADGYTDQGFPFTTDSINAAIDQVSYSTICINGVQQMIGGMLLQPDAMTLALAYTIANSIWMAPLAIGAGAGIYLTKNKLKR